MSSSQSHHAEVEALIEEIIKNGTLTLKTRSLKYFVLLLLLLGFTAFGIILILEGILLGWAVVGFFGFGVFVTASAVCGYRFYLVLTPEGFTMQTLILTYSYKWTDIEQFKTGWNYFIKTVWFRFSDSYESHSVLGKVGKALSDIRNLPDTYGMKAETLTELMNTLRERALHSGEKLF